MERIKLAIEKAKAEGRHPARTLAIARHSGGARVPPQTESSSGAKVTELRATPAPAAASLPQPATPVLSPDPAHLERHRVIAHQKTHPASWSFDVLRTQILQKMDEKGWRTLAITSPTLASGKSLIAVNLATSIAQKPERTALLVDFDLRRPSVGKLLGLDQPVSLNEVLNAQAPVTEALVRPGLERLVALPLNRPVAYASEVLASARVEELVRELRQQYDDGIVIFDLPPVLAADDVMAVLPHVDCVLMVVGSGASTKAEIEEAMTRLARANLIGVVLNKDIAPAQQDFY